MPSASQQSYFALRAFNVELASIKDGSILRRRLSSSGAEGGGGGDHSTSGGTGGGTTTSSSIALQLRMQWWRDALDTIYKSDESSDQLGNTSNKDPLLQSLSISCWHSPVVRSLYRAVQDHSLTRRFLERLVDARESDLELIQPATVQEMVDYAEETSSSLLYLSLECAGVRDDRADAVASSAGIGIGLALCLRATPFRLLHGEIPLASELFPKRFDYRAILRELEVQASRHEEASASVATGTTMSSPSSPHSPRFESAAARAWQEAARHVAREAVVQLQQAQDLQGHVPKAGRSCLLPVIPALQYLAKLEQSANYNLWDPQLLQPNPRSRLSLLLLMGRSWLTGVI
jgi:NADH dehydrogenase [ubiquinone] 1 alpha subcomplex assembly factor 6